MWWLAALIVIAGFLAYWNSLSSPFIYDDELSIVQNRQIRKLWSASVLSPERELPVAGRPLVNLSFAINYALGGLNVRGYHVGNVAVHLLCGLLVFGVLRRTLELPRLASRFASRSIVLAFAAALIWTLHPLNTEVVDYLTQRTESMMALFYLLTLYATGKAVGSPRPGRWHAVAITACALGMACKESMVTAPLMVVLYERIVVFESLKASFASRWRFYLGLAATWLVLAAVMWSGPRIHSAGFSTDTDVWTYLLNQTVMITEYLRRTIWPRSLVLNYGWPRAVTLSQVLPYALWIVFLLAVTGVALVRRPMLGFLGAWFFITLAPTSSVVPIGTEVGAERRMYLPLVALVVLGVVGLATLWDWVKRKYFPNASARETRVLSSAGPLALTAVAIALAAGTIARNREYSSSFSLARTVLERYPTGMAHHLIAVELMAAGNHDEAVRHLREAIAEAPRAHFSLGVELFNQGKLDEAIDHLREFIRKQPIVLEVISAHEYIGRAYVQQKRWPEAIAEFRQMLTKVPSDLTARKLLAETLFTRESFDEAIGQYKVYLESRPNDVDALGNLGIALIATEKMDEAVAVFRRAVEIAPNNGGARRNLANALFDGGNVQEAAVHAREAAALRPDDPAAHDVLGRALALQGKFAEAAAAFERALQIDPGYADARDHLERIRRLR